MMDLHFNQSLATGDHSGSQIPRVLTEGWMECLSLKRLTRSPGES